MLFRRDIEPHCAYCEHAALVNNAELVCAKHGTVSPEHHCKAFRYDPLKRVPPRPVSMRPGKFKASDFAL
ncbi:MAG: hypothetical protein IKO14_09085 [Oscillibacter sp.]|nr:hypothetical protein [Oscillibacter sp.]